MVYNERSNERFTLKHKIQLIAVAVFIICSLTVQLLATPTVQMTLAVLFKSNTYQIMEDYYKITYKDTWSHGNGKHRHRKYIISAEYVGEDIFEDKYKHPTISITHVTRSVYTSGDVGDTIILQWLYNKKTGEIVKHKYQILCRPK